MKKSDEYLTSISIVLCIFLIILIFSSFGDKTSEKFTDILIISLITPVCIVDISRLCAYYIRKDIEKEK